MASVAFPSLAKKAKLSDGTTYGYVSVPAQPGKPTLLLLHGCPSATYDWRYQIEHLPKAGYGLLAPDLLGYGDTDKPDAVEPYHMRNLAAHVEELIKVEGLDNVVGVGHDWGSGLLTYLVDHYPSRFTALVYMANGYSDLYQPFDLDQINAITKTTFGHSLSGYFHTFNAEDGAAMIEANDKAFDSLMFTANPTDWITHLGEVGGLKAFLDEGKELPIADFISAEELKTHNQIIMSGGYTGPLNWYKAFIRLFQPGEERPADAESRKVKVPTLLIVTEKDYICLADAQIYMMKPFFENLTVERKNTGHWVMLEDREGTEKTLEDWLATLQ